MADVFLKKQRSEIMSGIRSKNTELELGVFRALRGEKIYFNSHNNKVFVHPDISLIRKRRAVFIDRDFWHGWKFNRYRSLRKNTYWKNKISRNRARDTNKNDW